jgi:hypothetical protein
VKSIVSKLKALNSELGIRIVYLMIYDNAFGTT